MREILFKAKRLDDRNWIEGYYQKRLVLVAPDRERVEHLIFHYNSSVNWEYAEIDPETLCQYTGWTDSIANKIFENDIVEFSENDRYLVWWCNEMSMLTAIPVKDIQFNGTDYWSNNPKFTYADFCLMLQDPWGDFSDMQVVGNIIDNPELLPENSLAVKLTDNHVYVMKHAIGLDHNKPYTRQGRKFYRPYRNRFNTNCGNGLWNDLENAGLAAHGEIENRDLVQLTDFYLTRKGLDWLGNKLGVHIYDEEE